MDFLQYLIKANVGIILFYGFYRIFSSRDTFFVWKRFFLLFILFFSILYPFFDLSYLFTIGRQWTEGLSNTLPIYSLDEIWVTPQSASRSLFGSILAGTYFVGAGIFFVRMWIELLSITRIVYHSRKEKVLGRTVYASNQIETPFSFFGLILINPDKHADNELNEILLHEETHVKQIHSVDILFSELLCIIFWFNPFIWLIRNEIRMNLEYLADQSVVDSGCDAEHYQFHLLRLTYSKTAVKLTNNFNVSPLKQRILMMNKKQTTKLGITRYLFFIPLIAVLLLFNCSKSSKDDHPTQNESADPEVEMQTESISIAEDNDDKEDEKQVHNFADVMPQFPGGPSALYTFLGDNLKYPEGAKKKGIEGTVTLRFVVTEKGNVENITLLEGVDPELDKEAIRVVKLLPRFIPGRQDGKPVSVWFNLPVKYMLK